MTLLLLSILGCGADEPLDQPNPPPPPPPFYEVVEADVARYTGVVTEIHGPTRSFVLTGEGKRVLAMLAETATLRIGGMPSQVQDLVSGSTLHVEGRRDGDTLFILRASDTQEATPVTPVTPVTGLEPAGPTPGTDVVAPTPAAAPAEAPAEAPAPTP